MADMKFKFKIQQYQTDAVNAVVKVFEGQPFNDKVSYLRDMGKIQNQQIVIDDIMEENVAEAPMPEREEENLKKNNEKGK